MSPSKAVFVLVHGGWHNQKSWDKVVPLLEDAGSIAFTLDLPGSGAKTKNPKSLDAESFDPAAFAAELSPVAEVSHEERTQAVLELVAEAGSHGAPVILVGHSAGGIIISEVAERVPEQLQAIVYVAGFMVPNGESLLAMLSHDSMSSATSYGLFVGNPEMIGATRINPRATESDYRALLKTSFYADVSEDDFNWIVSELHSDEPNGGALAPSTITPERFGSVERHYVRTTSDYAVPLAGQDFMIKSVDETIGGTTITHTLASSHSPFLSQPENLTKILLDIAGSDSDAD